MHASFRMRRRWWMTAVCLPAMFMVIAGSAEAGSGELMERILAKMDSDGDGALSAAEGEAAAEAIFERRAANGDGILTREEFMAPAGSYRLSADQQEKLDSFRAGRFTVIDANGDGQVKAEEYFTAAQHRFEAADGNGDGRVTKEELRALGNAL